MRQRYALIFLALACLAGPSARAAVDPVQWAKTPLDFQLSDGQSFIRLSELPSNRISIINFWRSDCPPCLRELPLLATFQEKSPVRLLTIALQRPNEVASAPEHIHKALAAPTISLYGPSEPRGLLQRFGNPGGALPYTVVLDKQHRPCARQIGEVTTEWLQQAVLRCQTN